jgi:hypothetical protein
LTGSAHFPKARAAPPAKTVAARRLGLTQPRMNDLVRGRINKLSLDALLNIAARAGLAVRVKVVRPAAPGAALILFIDSFR